MSNNNTSLTLILATLVVAIFAVADHHIRKDLVAAEQAEARAHARASVIQAQHAMLECVEMPVWYTAREWCILFRTPK